MHIFSFFVGLEQLPFIFLEFRIWKQGRVNFDTLNYKLTSAVSQAIWDLVSEHHLLLAPLCYSENNSNDTPEVEKKYPNNQNISTLVPKACSKYKMPPGSRVKKTVMLIDIDQPLEISANVFPNDDNDSCYERGETGIVHPVYASMLVKWFEFAIEIGVPSIKKSHIQLKNRHPIGICLRELQHVFNSLAPDMTLKAFQFDTSDKRNYIPYDCNKTAVKCLLVARNFEQWKACVSARSDVKNDVHKILGSKLWEMEQNRTSTIQQKLLLGTVQSDELVLYMYNWSKERVDKLMIQGNSLGLWMSARSTVLNSIVAQKMGLFQNQAVSRKSLKNNNPYLMHVVECADHMQRFPLSGKQSINNKQQGTTQEQGISLDAFRDSFPYQKSSGHYSDIVVTYVHEMLDLKTRNRIYLDEKKKMHGIWQSRGAACQLLQTTLLRKHSRIIHYCHTPLLFLPTWRLQSAATRDHSLSPNRLIRVDSDSHAKSDAPSVPYNMTWHSQLCTYFIKEYKKYLQTLGFVPLELDPKIKEKCANHALCHVQKPMLGGVLVFSVQLKEPFFIVKLHAVECCRLQQKVSRNSVNQFTLSFLDECDKIKSLMHLHSFTYDFHLRTIHSYVADNLGPKVCSDFHLTKFLDDFTKYYPKTPNFARNVVCAGKISFFYI